MILFFGGMYKMKSNIRKLGKKTLATLLTISLLASMAVMCVTPALAVDVPNVPAPTDSPMLWYNYYTARMQKAIEDIEALLEDMDETGEVDLRNGYTLNLRPELEAHKAAIEIDLGVAAAIVGGVYNDPRFSPVQNSNTSTGYSQTNFNTAFGSTESTRFASAVKYLEQGGIAFADTKTTNYIVYWAVSLNWHFSLLSKLNPSFSSNVETGNYANGFTETGKLTSPTTLADLAENHPANLVKKLLSKIEALEAFSDAGDIDVLKLALLESECLDDECDNDDCNDWTHRLMVDQQEWIDAVNKFHTDVAHDINVIGQLATGNINGQTLYNTNGFNYYNNTVAPSIIDKLNAALSYLENGGYSSVTTSGTQGVNQTVTNWIAYKSDFTTYDISFSGGFLGSGFTVPEESEIIPLVEFHLEILMIGATPAGLETAYEYKVSTINSYIEQATALRGTTVPNGAMYNQGEYDAAIEAFIASAQRDLLIAAMLHSGNFLSDGEMRASYASIWEGFGTQPADFYLNGFNYAFGRTAGPGDTQEMRTTNAISFFNNGGYGNGFSIDLSFIPGLGRIGLEIEFKSSFHPDFSSGLFGISANKTNAVNIMRDTLAALKLGSEYLTPEQLIKREYEMALAKFDAMCADPSSILQSILDSDNSEVGQLLDDLTMLLNSIDDILGILGMVTNLGISDDVINSILGTINEGLSIELLKQLAELSKYINTGDSGDVDIKDFLLSLTDSEAGDFIGRLISLYRYPAIIQAGLGDYVGATATLQTGIDFLETNALGLLNQVLGPVYTMIEPIRPYLGMLTSGISLVYDVLDLFNQVSSLVTDFELAQVVGDVSGITLTISNVCFDLADLLENLEKADLGDMLSGLLGSEALGGIGDLILRGLAGGLNSLINGALGSDLLDLSAGDLGIIGDAANGLLNFGLGNLTNLADLLRATGSILRRAAGIGNDIQDAIDGNWAALLDMLIREGGDLFNGSTIGEFGDFFSALIGLFTGGNNSGGDSGPDSMVAQPAAALFAGLMDEDPELAGIMATSFGLDLGGSQLVDPMTAAFASGIVNMTLDCATYIKDPGCSASQKIARINAFKDDFRAYIAVMRNCAAEIREILYRDNLFNCINNRIIDNAEEIICKLEAIKCAINYISSYTCLNLSDINNCIDSLIECLRSKIGGDEPGEGCQCGKCNCECGCEACNCGNMPDCECEGDCECPPFVCNCECGCETCNCGSPEETHTHSYSFVVTAPTCTEAGYTTYTCECGDSYISDIIAALGHNYIGVVTLAPTATTDGVMTYTCSRCGDWYTEVIPATGTGGGDPGGYYDRGTGTSETTLEDMDVALSDVHSPYVEGYPDGTFKPEGQITRGEVATIFYRMLPAMMQFAGTSGTFSDVPDNSWYAGYINCLADLGILEGDGDGKYRPEDPITREEFTAMVCKFYEVVLLTAGNTAFPDVDSNGWAYFYIITAVDLGWVIGYEDGTFRPTSNITRAEAVTLVNHILDRCVLTENIPSEYYDMYPDLQIGHWAFQDILEASILHFYVIGEDGTEIWQMDSGDTVDDGGENVGGDIG